MRKPLHGVRALYKRLIAARSYTKAARPRRFLRECVERGIVV